MSGKLPGASAAQPLWSAPTCWSFRVRRHTGGILPPLGRRPLPLGTVHLPAGALPAPRGHLLLPLGKHLAPAGHPLLPTGKCSPPVGLRPLPRGRPFPPAGSGTCPVGRCRPPSGRLLLPSGRLFLPSGRFAPGGGMTIRNSLTIRLLCQFRNRASVLWKPCSPIPHLCFGESRAQLSRVPHFPPPAQGEGGPGQEQGGAARLGDGIA